MPHIQCRPLHIFAMSSTFACSADAAKGTFSSRRIMLCTSGTRGDIQPFIALGSSLKDAGYAVLIATNLNHMETVKRFGLEVRGVFLDMERAVRENTSLHNAMATGEWSKFAGFLAGMNFKFFPESFRLLANEFSDWKPDFVLTAPLCALECTALGGLHGIPCMKAVLQWRYSIVESNEVVEKTRFMIWAAEAKSKNSTMLALAPQCELFTCLDYNEFLLSVTQPLVPTLVGFSPYLLSKSRFAGSSILQHSKFTGFWTLNEDIQTKQQSRNDPDFGGALSEDIRTFLQKGKPVYIGWGSMVSVSAQKMTCSAVRALMASKLRGVILEGYASLGPALLRGHPDTETMLDYVREHVIFVKSAPHEWLFPRCSVIVHHGGVGTTAAALRSGAPSVVTPCAFDQFDNAQLVQDCGVGIALENLSSVTVETLASALQRCVTDATLIHAARHMASRLLKEDGLKAAVDAIDSVFVNDVRSGRWSRKFELRKREIILARSSLPKCFAWISRLCPCKADISKMASLRLFSRSHAHLPRLLDAQQSETMRKVPIKGPTDRALLAETA